MRIDGGATARIDGTSALAEVGLPVGLPFVGDEPPACSLPGVARDFEAAGSLHAGYKAIRTCKSTCTDCPYLMPCRDWAITEREAWGVWGGMTPRERRAEKRRRDALALLASVHNA